jgi:hypothetical protein
MDTAWTFSRLESFESCPKKFYHLTVVKDVVEPPSDAIKWGHLVHTAFENLIKDGTPLPDTMQHWSGIAAKLLQLKGEKLTEQPMALTKAFQPAEWGNAWTRGIADLLVIDGDTATVIDYKTGKRKPTEQLALYAAYVFAAYSGIKTVKTAFIWLKEKKIDKEVFSREQLPEIWQSFLPRVRRLEIAYEKGAWAPKPSGLCRGWCAVKQCEHNKG